MISADALRQKLLELPKPVLEYLYSEQVGSLNEQIISRNSLDEAQEEILFPLLKELFVEEVQLERLLDETKTRFGFDEAKAKALAADIVGYRLLPLDKWLGDVSGTLRRLGGDPKAYPKERIQLAERTQDEAADEVVTAAAPDADLHLKSRLHNVVESFLAGIRTEAQVKDALTRPEKIGGAGLEPAVAEHVLEEAKEEVRSVLILPEASEEALSSAASSPAAPKIQPAHLALTLEDEAEVAKFVVMAPAASRSVDRLIEEIYATSGLATDDETLQKRVKMVIGNRLRDVRDQMETLEIMTQPKELGGLGLGLEAARALLATIQSSLRKSEAEQQAKVRTEKIEWVEKERLQQAHNETQDRLGQKAELERLYQSIVAKSAKAKARAEVAPVLAVPVLAAADVAPASNPKLAAPANLPIASANPVPPAFRPPTPIPVPAAPLPPRPSSPPPITLVKPERIDVPSVPSASGSFAQRPKLEDVKAAPKLTGPVEELRAITIVDFRRLSKDPKEACLKIKDKIDLLADQSYTRRSEGIAAWTASEVVRTYLELMRESLNGTPLPQAIAAREVSKKPALNAEEFRAVAELSRQLRY